MSEIVLDASALLAVLAAEPGWEDVAELVPGAAMSAVNVAEVVGKLADRGMPEEEIREALGGLGLEVVPFDESTALAAGMLLPETKQHGLSLGDRACLALARLRSVPAVTTDRAWANLTLGVEIRVLRP
ncbi:MAG: type II toxin-antitoxin system VapC family toxin [Acidobacteriota bacterium]